MQTCVYSKTWETRFTADEMKMMTCIKTNFVLIRSPEGSGYAVIQVAARERKSAT